MPTRWASTRGSGTYTNFVNLLGWCALALPAGMTAAKLPFGVTFIAPGAHDAALAGFGRRWMDAAPAALPQPAPATAADAADCRGRRAPVGPAA